MAGAGRRAAGPARAGPDRVVHPHRAAGRRPGGRRAQQPEIAAALFISVKTVEANLTRIYRKLGLRGRVDLARRSIS